MVEEGIYTLKPRANTPASRSGKKLNALSTSLPTDAHCFLYRYAPFTVCNSDSTKVPDSYGRKG